MLARSVKLLLRDRQLDVYDYTDRENPPILHRKESFLAPDHPLHERFARLTQQEERLGLLDDSSAIGTKKGWEERLETHGFAIRGHRVVRSKPSTGS